VAPDTALIVRCVLSFVLPKDVRRAEPSLEEWRNAARVRSGAQPVRRSPDVGPSPMHSLCGSTKA
jgi:hypothetical protein